ncbi:YlmC/YmxH family sporulation protein [Proteinivorax hydrogeniformans]|uniref:YlmC/YmxH family sporulation protein n=1 Tax=Proteinivorax hydrogeniformans TaxID=1826727 RepID=A0AAU8HNW2_9FIRM
MRFSELDSKEIINYSDGKKLGVVGNCDLVIDIETGGIKELIIPDKANVWSTLSGNTKSVTIPWSSIKKIGQDTIIVNVDEE